MQLVVRHRRHSQLPLSLPVGCEQLKDTAVEAVEAQKIQERFKEIPPQEREILRKLGFRLQESLLAAQQEFFPPTPQTCPSLTRQAEAAVTTPLEVASQSALLDPSVPQRQPPAAESAQRPCRARGAVVPSVVSS